MAIVETLDPAYLKVLIEGIKGQTDKFTFDGSGYLYVNAASVGNPPNLDVALSTRASESTLQEVRDRLPSSLTGSGNFMVAIEEDAVGLAKESTLSGIKGQTDKLTFDANSYLYVNAAAVANPSNLDVALSTRASESTLSGIKSQTDKLTFDGSSYLYVNAASVANPPNLDVALSTRLSESTFTGRVPVLNVASMDVAGSTRNALAVVPSIGGDITRMPYLVEDISVSTTESSISIDSPGAKAVIIRNKGDVDVKVGVNGSVPASNPLKVRARCQLVFVHKGITSLYFVTDSGSSTVDVAYWN